MFDRYFSRHGLGNMVSFVWFLIRVVLEKLFLSSTETFL